MLSWTLIIRKLCLRLFVKSDRKKDICLWKKKHSDSRSVENISDKRLRSDVQPAETDESTTNVVVDRSI